MGPRFFMRSHPKDGPKLSLATNEMFRGPVPDPHVVDVRDCI